MTTIVLFEIWPRTDVDEAAYEQAYVHMLSEVDRSGGCLSVQDYGASDGSRQLAVAVFESVDDVKRWRDDAEHAKTRDRGRQEFFQKYQITIARAGRSYSWDLAKDDPDSPPPQFYSAEY